MTGPSRRRARNRLYLVGVLPALLLLLVSGRIALVLQAESSGQDSYARGSFAQARDSFAANAALNPFERWIAPFDAGVARHREGDLGGAVDSYEEALEHVPESWECAVRSNMALAHEAIGDAALAERRAAAEASWAAGRAALADCLALEPPRDVDDEDSEDDRADVVRQQGDRATAEVVDARLAAKLIDAQTDPAPEPAPPVPEEETFAEREQRLDVRDRRSLEERRQQEQEKQEDEDRLDPDETPPVPTW